MKRYIVEVKTKSGLLQSLKVEAPSSMRDYIEEIFQTYLVEPAPHIIIENTVGEVLVVPKSELSHLYVYDSMEELDG